jgi:mannose-6-phosphate isomerase
MAIERARAQTVRKPWGVADLRPWNTADHDGGLYGEIWYERPGNAEPDPSLLLKLLFTSQPLSIQVHPDDAYAQSMGQARGKAEAWYILSAAPGAKIALGLKKHLTSRQLREAVDDGSIAGLVAWRAVFSGDIVSVPAGTIHAVGAGLVIAEIQQRSDATFRMFDFGRKRELHVANAVAVADAVPAKTDLKSKRLTDERTLLVSNTHFAFERIDLTQRAVLHLEAEHETWLLVVSGSGRAGGFNVVVGDAIFLQSDSVDLHAGPKGMTSLMASAGVGWPAPRLLERPAQPTSSGAGRPKVTPTSIARTKSASPHGQIGTMQ